MYTKAFKALMVKKMADPSGPGPKGIADEVGVSRSTLYRWASQIDTVDVVDQPEPIECHREPPIYHPIHLSDWLEVIFMFYVYLGYIEPSIWCRLFVFLLY